MTSLSSVAVHAVTVYSGSAGTGIVSESESNTLAMRDDHSEELGIEKVSFLAEVYGIEFDSISG